MRATDKVLTDIVESLHHDGVAIKINWMNGYCHLQEPLPTGGHRKRFSGTNHEVYIWLQGFCSERNWPLQQAAPDLLAQLKAVVVQIEHSRHLIVPPNLRAAIAKAEGRKETL